MFDLHAYLARIGIPSATPSLAQVHAAHGAAIPFEALDPQRGIANSLEGADLQRKLVDERRGGYCFEQNLLLKTALEALGFEDVELYLARVLLGAEPGVVRARSHLLLKVRADGADWLADVGFGANALFEPLPWGPSGEHVQAGWRFRVIELGPEHVLQAREGESWNDLYSFLPHPVPQADVETVNWWTSTHPASRFVNGLLVSRQWPDGRRLALSDWGGLALIERTAEQTARTVPERAEIPRLLADRFDLPGFALGPDGRLVKA